jgi:hypothetical protein
MILSGVHFWWIWLCTISTVNVLAWSYSATRLAVSRNAGSSEILIWRRWQVFLAAGYVFGCAYRATFPVFDVPRQVLFDTWLSSVIVGRTVATIAELCFAAQWALLVASVSRATGSSVAKIVSFAVVPMIAFAEVCSWYSVLTTSNIGHVVEESVWGLCAALIVVCLVTLWPRSDSSLRRHILGFCAATAAYVVYMFAVDVPMYWSRWVADEAANRNYFDLIDGARSVAAHWVVSSHWGDWKSEVIWMSLYFSIGVWLSIALIHAPVPFSRRTTVGVR